MPRRCQTTGRHLSLVLLRPHIHMMTLSQKPPATLRLASYNIRKCIGLDRRRRPDRVLEVMQAVGADLLVLQEVDRRFGARAATLTPGDIRAATGLEALPIAENDVSLGWHGNAILARPEIGVAQIERLRLPGLEPRGTVMVRLEIGAASLTLAAVHLALVGRHRRQQLGFIAQHLGKARAGPAVVAGDFNEWSRRSALEGLQSFDVHVPGHSFHSARPMAGLDRIAAGPGVEVLATGVHRAGQARQASDHLPIWADLRLDGTCNAPRSGVEGRATVGV